MTSHKHTGVATAGSRGNAANAPARTPGILVANQVSKIEGAPKQGIVQQWSSVVPETEAARLVNLSPRSLQRLRVDGSGPAFIQLGERRIAYRLADLDAWLASRRISSGRAVSPEVV